ncbi:MAG: hypothetical protein IJD48_02415 [Clostridia bacterium]|nr:hypothetical protein [Clostridia bacterium]
MDNNDVKTLIATFMEYRDLISPIEQNLREFSVSFESIKSDIKNLNDGFDGSLQSKLDKIYKELANQADKAKALAVQVDNFMVTTNKYVSSVDALVDACSKIENKLSAVNDIEKKAETQIERLNQIIDDKKKNYDIKELEKSLENYNKDVQKVNEYINRDVAEALKTSSDKINKIKDKNENILEAILEEKESIDKLIESYNSSNKLLKKVVESNDVNEQYIFEILDKWAEQRRLKIKK